MAMSPETVRALTISRRSSPLGACHRAVGDADADPAGGGGDRQRAVFRPAYLDAAGGGLDGEVAADPLQRDVAGPGLCHESVDRPGDLQVRGAELGVHAAAGGHRDPHLDRRAAPEPREPTLLRYVDVERPAPQPYPGLGDHAQRVGVAGSQRTQVDGGLGGVGRRDRDVPAADPYGHNQRPVDGERLGVLGGLERGHDRSFVSGGGQRTQPEMRRPTTRAGPAWAGVSRVWLIARTSQASTDRPLSAAASSTRDFNDSGSRSEIREVPSSVSAGVGGVGAAGASPASTTTRSASRPRSRTSTTADSSWAVTSPAAVPRASSSASRSDGSTAYESRSAASRTSEVPASAAAARSRRTEST